MHLKPILFPHRLSPLVEWNVKIIQPMHITVFSSGYCEVKCLRYLYVLHILRKCLVKILTSYIPYTTLKYTWNILEHLGLSCIKLRPFQAWNRYTFAWPSRRCPRNSIPFDPYGKHLTVGTAVDPFASSTLRLNDFRDYMPLYWPQPELHTGLFGSPIIFAQLTWTVVINSLCVWVRISTGGYYW